MTGEIVFGDNEILTPAYVKPTWKGVGWPLPDNGMINFVLDEHAINSSLRILLQTEPGERLMENDFGTPMRDLLFEQSYPGLEEDAAMRVADAISRWETRIVIMPPGIETNIVEENTISSTGATAMGLRFIYAFKSNVSVRHVFDMLMYRKVTGSDGIGKQFDINHNLGDEVKSFNL